MRSGQLHGHGALFSGNQPVYAGTHGGGGAEGHQRKLGSGHGGASGHGGMDRSGEGSISFHVYRFNTQELEAAKEFAISQDLQFHPYYPYFNGNSMAQEYIEGSMEPETRAIAEQELFLSHVEGLLKERPQGYHCFLENIISIDCNGRLVLCCASDDACESYIWDSVFEIHSFEEMKKIRQKMLKSVSCQRCRQLGIDYWMEKNPAYQEKEKE